MMTVAILGAGNGGCAAAADLTSRGFKVRLYSRSAARLAPIRERGGLDYTGVIGDGFARLDTVTDDLAEAVAEAELVMIVTPAVAHARLAEQLARLLPEGRPIWLNPGSTAGALHVRHCLARFGRSDIPVAESATLTYACRMKGPATVWIKNEVTRLPFAALPGRRVEELLGRYQTLYPNLIAAPNVLATSLMNLNAVTHPPGMVMNAGWIEDTQGDFKFYYEGVTAAVSIVLGAVDAERLEIVRRLVATTGLELDLLSCLDFFYQTNYTTRAGHESGTMYGAYQESVPNRPTQAAPTLNNRYMVEDVPFGLVPMIVLADWVGAEVPAMRAVATMASALMGQDYFQAGLSLEDMGLAGVPLERVAAFLLDGG